MSTEGYVISVLVGIVLSAFWKYLDRLNGKLDSIDAKLEKHTDSISDLKSDFRLVEERYEATDKRVDAVCSRCEKQHQRVVNL